MDTTIAKNFIENISKHIQLLLRHYIPFDHQVEVMGHLNINVDFNSRVNYIVSEKCEKEKDSEFKAISSSFHVSPDRTSVLSPACTLSPVKDDELQTPLPTPAFKRPHSTPLRKSPMKRSRLSSVRKSPNESPSTSTDTHGDAEQSDDLETDDMVAAVNEPASENEEDEGEDDTESFMSDVSFSEETVADDGVEYTIIEYGTQMGKPLLVDNIGYSYNLRIKHSGSDDSQVPDSGIWRCTKRNKKLLCPASVHQNGESFTTGNRAHLHAPQKGLLTSALIYAEIRNQAMTDFQTPASKIVARALSVGGGNEANLPKESNLRRLLSRYRCRERKRLTEGDLKGEKEEDHEYLTIILPDTA
ncbi:hypothetical protein LOTGIDRAFT_231653 [Lottia gigantea]|uniref:FLYWCH-type domain-containing protein n=1 Tax=Lottia gigantea TaxID=225164 RepID=V4C5E8_LOTGI|nr:hypothetical protein LOTGIDRAFT_231653 [Lottia gigantea]ESO96819.1 hypothetical protein LOTGIDRAFT_231653 [Lottia gigantea]